MNLATLRHDEATSTWSAEFDGQVLVKSVGGESSKQYVVSRITEGRCSKAIKANVTGFSNFNVDAFAASPVNGAIGKAFVARAKPNNALSVNERYELLDECVDIVVRNIGIRSLIITGEGSLGKTFHTKKKIREHGLLSTEEAIKAATEHTEQDKASIAAVELAMKKWAEHAEQHYRENPPAMKKKKAEADEDSEEDEDEFSLNLVFGNISYDLHLSMEASERLCGGTFSFPACNYRFNLKLMNENLDEYITQIVPHEMAHHINHLINAKAAKKDSHGREWQAIMINCFGKAADQFHVMDVQSVKNAPDLVGDYHYVKGYSSAKGLFRTLFENKKKLVIFDDCDAAWKNEVGANLLKAALDSDEERWVTWNVEGSANDDLPKSFLFEGRVIFISNVASGDFPQPLISRSLRADLELTIEERFERMLQILPSDQFAPGISMEVKTMAYEFLFDNREIAAEISSRSLLNVIQVANSGSKLWKKIALANIA